MTTESFVFLFVIATAVALLTRRWRMPYTVALVLAGLVLGSLGAFEPPLLTRELLFTIFLPGLLFEAAFHIEFSGFWRDRRIIASLAVPGVVLSIAVITLVMAPLSAAAPFLRALTWRDALVFAGVITATDPIAVVALFKSLGVPRRLSTLIEGESLLNDGTAVVLFTIVLGIALGRQMGVAATVLEFVRVVGFGALIGAAIGLGISYVIARVDDAMIEITLTTIAAYGAFILAERLSASGVIATVAAGMLCGNEGAERGMSPSTRVAVETFWEYIAFALNSIVFLLIGFEVGLPALLRWWPAVLVAYAATMAARALIMVVVTRLRRARGEPIPHGWTRVLIWGGLRGGLSMVLALSIPAALPNRPLVVTITFGVVLLTILVNGLTMAPLLRRLGIVAEHEARAAYYRARGEIRAASAALGELERVRRSQLVDEETLRALRAEYETRLGTAEARLREIRVSAADLNEQERARVRHRLILAEKEQLIRDLRGGLIEADAYRSVMADVDARLLDDDGSAATT